MSFADTAIFLYTILSGVAFFLAVLWFTIKGVREFLELHRLGAQVDADPTLLERKAFQRMMEKGESNE